MNNINSIFNVIYSQELSESTKSDILENLVSMCGDSLLYSTITESEFEHEDLLEFYWNVSHSELSEDVRNFIVDEVLSIVDEDTINVVTDEFIKMSVQEAIYNYYSQPMSLTEEIINEVSFGKKLGVALGRLGQSTPFARAPKAPELPKDIIGLARLNRYGKDLKKWDMQVDRFKKSDFGEKATKAFKSAGATAGENIGKALTGLISKKKETPENISAKTEPKHIVVEQPKEPDLKSKIKNALTTTNTFKVKASDIPKNKAKNIINKVADSVKSQISDINKNRKKYKLNKDTLKQGGDALKHLYSMLGSSSPRYRKGQRTKIHKEYQRRLKGDPQYKEKVKSLISQLKVNK